MEKTVYYKKAALKKNRKKVFLFQEVSEIMDKKIKRV